jgi:catechol 2,3-dioxygenase-like lactoylglutathione lyase family enzyme
MAAKVRHSRAFEQERATSISSPSLPSGRWFWWGRVIFHVADVDALYDRALAAGYEPASVPHDAEWGERFFHLVDPDGHELSFAQPLLPVSV